MDTQFLEENPFYVLGVTPTDKRSTIIGAAEEKSFFCDGNTYNEAQASLLNPAKRLAAEMDWFCGCSVDTMTCIHASIERHVAIPADELIGLARLNATLYNFAISLYDDYFELGYAIFDIDKQYSSIDEETLTGIINACHAEACILQISKDELSRELNKKREQIQHLIADKTQVLSEAEYIEFITMLAEKCFVDENCSDGVNPSLRRDCAGNWARST